MHSDEKRVYALWIDANNYDGLPIDGHCLCRSLILSQINATCHYLCA